MILIDRLIFAVDEILWCSYSVELMLMLKVTFMHITLEEYVYY